MLEALLGIHSSSGQDGEAAHVSVEALALGREQNNHVSVDGNWQLRKSWVLHVFNNTW